MSTATILSPLQIDKLSSDYLADGRREERWRFNEIRVESGQVFAVARMEQYYRSATDDNQFHLSYITGHEIASQLGIIFLHYNAGFTEKCREVWMSESHNRCFAPIRDPLGIHVAMTINRLKKRKELWLCDIECELTDVLGGRLLYWAKAVLL